MEFGPRDKPENDYFHLLSRPQGHLSKLKWLHPMLQKCVNGLRMQMSESDFQQQHNAGDFGSAGSVYEVRISLVFRQLLKAFHHLTMRFLKDFRPSIEAEQPLLFDLLGRLGPVATRLRLETKRTALGALECAAGAAARPSESRSQGVPTIFARFGAVLSLKSLYLKGDL